MYKRQILKYQRIDVAEREKRRREWNDPVLWPLAVGALLLLSVLLPALISYRRRERGTARSQEKVNYCLLYTSRCV